jgi:4-amino-4-deoxy-L-arabinose transferase-like glycosyltransferase
VPKLPSRLRTSSVICASLILVHAILLSIAALENSAIFDEPAHLAAGVEYWHHGDFSIYSLTPPLLRLWAALPAVLDGAHAPMPARAAAQPLRQRHWVYAFDFLAANARQFESLLKLARLGMIPLSCFAAWLVYRWAADLYGQSAGLAACAMYCLNPSILANGSLITVDIGTTAAILASAYVWWKFCQAPRPSTWLLACIAVTAAHLCKFTALLLWPMLLAMTLAAAISLPRSKRNRLVAALLALTFAVLFLLNALYGFRGTLTPLRAFHFDSDLMQSVQRTLPLLPSPAPRMFVLGFDAQKYDSQGVGYQGFLFGQVYFGARWSYYPLALLCKLPFVMLILISLAAISPFLVRPVLKKLPGGELSLLLALGVFAAGVVFLGDLNIGTRYLLPAFPLAMILISRLWREDSPPSTTDAREPAAGSRGSLLARARNILLLLLATETLLVCPYYLSFVNVAAGGTANGWRLLTDSDFDWGQGLIALRRWMRNNNVTSVTQAYFGFVDPSIYSIRSTPITARSDEPFVAISSYYLNGLENRLVIHGSDRVIIRLPYAAALRRYKPVVVVGDTIFIYSRRDVEFAAAEAASDDPSLSPPPVSAH